METVKADGLDKSLFPEYVDSDSVHTDSDPVQNMVGFWIDDLTDNQIQYMTERKKSAYEKEWRRYVDYDRTEFNYEEWHRWNGY